jgi:parvulin-like peptidyl-prolyl isomerase
MPASKYSHSCGTKLRHAERDGDIGARLARCPLAILAAAGITASVLNFASAQTQPGPPAGTPVDDQVMAWVGKQPIFASEILSKVDQLMEEHRQQIPPERWDEQRLALAQQALKATVESKLVLEDALRKIPAAGQVEIEKKVEEQFEAEQIKKLMESKKAQSRSDLEQKLRAEGSSLDQQRRIYFERSLAYQWARSAVKTETEVSHNEKVAYYDEHRKDFERPARVRWEQLSILFERVASKQEAWAKLAQLGNDVMRGVPLADVAKAASHGATAEQGGQWDWTSKSSLASAVLDQALFSLPVGTLSPILEDERGFHIIRVIEREDAGRTSFRDAQVKIKEKIEEQRREKAVQDYYARLKKETYVWTVFDDPAGSQRFAESLRTDGKRR